MMKIFKWSTWRSYRLYIMAALTALFLTGLAVSAVMYTMCDNPAPQLWAVDDTGWITVATNSDAGVPTREVPVYMEAQVERIYGLHIGTVNHVRYKIVALSSVKMRFETLFKGILSRYKTTWEVVEPPKLVSEEKANGYTTRIVELTVRVWEPPSLPDNIPQGGHYEFLAPPAIRDKMATPVPLAASPQSAQAAVANGAAAPDGKADAANAPARASGDDAAAGPDGPVEPRLWPMTAEFIVATDVNQTNHLPKWEYIETPPINFGFASLLEPDADKHGLDFGPMGDVPDHPNRVGVAMVRSGYAVTACGAAYLVYLLFAWWRRRKQPKPVPEEIVAYRDAMLSAEDAKNMRSHLEQVRVAVRQYLGGATLDDLELLALWDHHPERERVSETLNILRQAGRSGRLNSLEESNINDLMNALVEERQRVVKPATRWSRLKAAVGARTSKMTRFAKPAWRWVGGSHLTSAARFGRNLIRRKKRNGRRK